MNYETLLEEKRSLRDYERVVNKTLKPYGVTSGGWLILNLVNDHGPMTIGSLSKALGTSMAFVTTTVNILEARGLVIKSADTGGDNRKKLVKSISPGLHVMNKQIAKVGNDR